MALADASVHSVPVQCRRHERGIRRRQHARLGRRRWQDEGVEHRDGRREDGGAGWLQVRAVEREGRPQTAGRPLRVHGARSKIFIRIHLNRLRYRRLKAQTIKSMLSSMASLLRLSCPHEIGISYL